MLPLRRGAACGSRSRVIASGLQPHRSPSCRSSSFLGSLDRLQPRLVHRQAAQRQDRIQAGRSQGQLRLERMGRWWFWAVAALCAGGVAGFVLTLYSLLYGGGIAMYQHTKAALNVEARNVTDGREEQNKKLHAVVTSLKTQLKDAKNEVLAHSRQAQEMRSNYVAAGKAEHSLHQQISKMKAEHATLATKHRLTVTALQKKLKIARAALREHHTRPAVPSAAAFLPMPPATMPAATAKPTPTVTIIDTEATPASKESVPVLEVEVASTSSGNLSEAEQMAGDDKNSVQLEARAQTLERELSDAEDNLRDYIEELDEAGTDATMQDAQRTLVEVQKLRSLRDELARTRTESKDVRASVESAETDLQDMLRRAEAAESDAEDLKTRLTAAEEEAKAHAARVEELEKELEARAKKEIDSAAERDHATMVTQLASVLLCTAGASNKAEKAAQEEIEELQLRISAMDKQLKSISSAALQDKKSESGFNMLTDSSYASASPAVAAVQAAFQGLQEGRQALQAQVEELTERCEKSDNANEELRLNNEELLFIMDTREAVMEQLKGKISELASTPSARTDGAVADWLQGIKPALDKALADLQEKRAFLENARGMCDSLKADITALRRLSDATFSQMPVDVSEVLAGVAEKHKELQAQLEQQQGTFDAQLQEERDNSQQLLKKERAALQVQMQNERAEMQQELETLRTQVVKAQAAANAAHEDKQLLQRQLTMSVDTNERLKTDLEAQKDESNKQIEALQEDVTRAGSRTESMLEAARTETSDVRVQHASLMRAYESLQAVHSSTKEQADQVAAQLEEARRAANNVAKHVQERNSDSEGIDAELLVAQLQDAEERNLRLQKEVRRMEKGMSNPGDARTVRHLRAEVTHLKASNATLRSDNQQLRESSQVVLNEQDDLRKDNIRILRELEILREDAAALREGEQADMLQAAAAADSQAAQAQSEALQQVTQVFEDYMQKQGMAQESAEVVRSQAQRIMAQRQTINDLNDLLRKRDRDMRRARAQLKSITAMPKEGLNLKQLAAQAALATGLQEQVAALSADNEALRRAAQTREFAGLGDRAGRQLQALASAFALGDSFREQATDDVQASEQLGSQDPAVVDFNAMVSSGRVARGP